MSQVGSGTTRLNLDKLIDAANRAKREISDFKIPFVLSPKGLMAEKYAIPKLVWDSIRYNDDAELDRVPNDRRGVYAFVVCNNNDVLPLHGYVLYIGIAGRDSSRPLRERYKDYLNIRKVIKRDQIVQMIGTWHEVLRFFFAPVDNAVSSDELKALEIQLNSALMPPFSEGDLEADLKRKRKAFRL